MLNDLLKFHLFKMLDVLPIEVTECSYKILQNSAYIRFEKVNKRHIVEPNQIIKCKLGLDVILYFLVNYINHFVLSAKHTNGIC